MSALDRGRPPLPGAGGLPRFPAIRRAELPGGSDLLALPLDHVPLVSLELVLPAGAEHDPPEAGGLATLTAALLDEGAGGLDAMAIAARIERTGGYLTSWADWDAAYLRAGVLASELDAALDLLATCALSPDFPPSEVERLRRQRQAEILARRDQPAALADERLVREVFSGTAYGHPLIGDEESLAQLDRAALVGFHAAHLAPRQATLVAAGDFDLEHLTARVASLLAGWGERPAAPTPSIAPRRRSARAIHVVNRPGAAQTELRLGHPGIDRRDPDFAVLRVANALLGGKFTSRINLNLRERHGYTYGASSRFGARRGPGPFVVSAAVSTEHCGAAAREVIAELERLQGEPVPEAELAEARGYLLGVMPYTLETADDWVGRLEEIAVHSLPLDELARHALALAAVTAADVERAARAHLRPAELTVVAVGPANDLAPQLEGLGELRVWESDDRGRPAAQAGQR